MGGMTAVARVKSALTMSPDELVARYGFVRASQILKAREKRRSDSRRSRRRRWRSLP
jgi:hypothetical protein